MTRRRAGDLFELLARPAVFGPALLGLLLRVVYLVEASDNPFWRNLGLDALNYDRWARGILSGRGALELPFGQAPFFPHALALAYALTGSDPVRALWLHLLPQTLAIALTAAATARAFGDRAGLAAGLALALYKPAIFYTGVLLPPSWTLLLASCVLYATARLLPRHVDAPLSTAPADSTVSPIGATAAATGGLFAGCLVLSQPTALGLVVPLLPLATRARLPRRVPGSFAIGLAAPLLATLLANGIGGGAWGALSWNGGLNFYIGNSAQANGAYVKPEGLDPERDPLGLDVAERALSPAGSATRRPVSVIEADRYWRGRALADLAADPGRIPALLGRKLYLFFGQREVQQVESLEFERRWSWMLRLPLPGMACLLALACLGAVLRWPRTQSLVLAVLATAALVCLFFVLGRFRLAIAPHLSALLGAGLSATGLPRRRLLSGLGLALLLFVGSLATSSAFDRGVDDGEYLYRLGVVAEKEKRPVDAQRWYEEAVRADPSRARARVNLGALLARAGRTAEARVQFEGAVRAEPTLPRAHLNLAQLEQIEGQLDAALREYREAAALDPSLVSAQEGAMYTGYELGQVAEAEAAARRLVSPQTTGTPAERRAAAFLALLNDRRSTLGADWQTSAAVRRADLLLVQGRVDEARAAYQLVSTDDPGRGAAEQQLARLARR